MDAILNFILKDLVIDPIEMLFNSECLTLASFWGQSFVWYVPLHK